MNINHRESTRKGIALSNGAIRTLSQEEANPDRDPSDFPVNSKGERLPSIYMGTLRVPLDVAAEFRYWDERKESESYGFTDVLRYLETPEVIWEQYSSKISPEAPCCRGCEFFNFFSKNEAIGSCSLGRVEGAYKASRPVCRVREVELKSGRVGLPIKKKMDITQDAPPVYGEKAPEKSQREPLRGKRKLLRRTDMVEPHTSQIEKEKASGGLLKRRQPRKMKSIEELSRGRK